MGGLLCKDGKTSRFSLAFKMEKGWEGLGLGWGLSLELEKKNRLQGAQMPGLRRGWPESFPEVWLVSEH